MSEDFIQLYSGKPFHFLEPREEEVDIDDVAHTLSLLCRFGGHCKKFYSVAEHSVRCSWEVSDEFALEALLHDATEAYLVDMPRPIKYAMPQYKEFEDKIDIVVRKKFGLPEKMSKEVHLIDNVLLATERRDLMKESEKPWNWLPDPLDYEITPWTPGIAQSEFINRYHELTNG